MIAETRPLDLVKVGLLLLAALGGFLFYDLMFAISVHLQITIVYALFWLLIAIILLRRRPRQDQLSILILFLAALALIYLINWDSRKLFLKDFYRVEAGMTATQVDQLMTGYLRFISPDSKLDSRGQLLEGTISYRHTRDGWGDSDIGVLTFKDGRVVQTTFYPD